MASLETIEAILLEFKRNTENHLTQLNGKANYSKTWIEENKDFIDNLKKERENTYKRYVDLAWKVIIGAIAIVYGIKSLM